MTGTEDLVTMELEKDPRRMLDNEFVYNVILTEFNSRHPSL